MSTDTCVIDTEDWQGSDICTVGDVGGGLFAEEIASDGDNGPGYAYPSLDLPADNGLEIIGRVTLIPAGLHIAAEEDTSGSAYADADGVYVAKWQLYVGLVATGDEKDLEYVFGPVTADIGYTESSDTVLAQIVVGDASSVYLDVGYTEASDTVAAMLNVGLVDLAVGYAEAGDVVSVAVAISPPIVEVGLSYVEASDTVAASITVAAGPVQLDVGYTEASDIVVCRVTAPVAAVYGGAVAIMRALLVAHVPLTALVPAGRIFAGIVPQGTLLPAISIQEVSGIETGTVARLQATTQNRSRVQVTIVAKSLLDQKRILAATKLGAGVHRGTFAGYKTLSVLPGGIGPDMNNLDDDGIYEQSRDFMVTFMEAN